MTLLPEVIVRGWTMVLVALMLVGGSLLPWSGADGGPVALAAPRAQTPDDVAVGIIVDTTNPKSMKLAREAGFTHAKMVVHWPRLEEKRGRYAWRDTRENDLDNVMKAARAEKMKLIVRVDGVPGWAGGSPGGADLAALADFYAAMAAHASGVVVGYEILNEPNLPYEWGGPPNPSGYAAFLKAASKGIKKGDPAALVIGGGVSPRTGGNGGTMEDVDFLRGMYAAGAKGTMNALSVHNYGGNYEPERDPNDCSICFRRAEVYRQVMEEAGDGATKVWATEFGWLMDAGRDMGQYDWMEVTEDQQADYVVRSFRYARANWPWMTGMLLSNLDGSTSPYHTGHQNGMPWFAILNKDHSPRKAWHAVKQMSEQDAATARRSPAPAAPVAASAPAADASSAGATAATVEPAPPAPATDSAGELAALAAAGAIASAGTAGPSPSAVQAGAPPAATRAKVAQTDGTGVNLRARPSATGDRLALLAEGTSVDVVGQDVQADGHTWRNVRTTAGQTGWVAGQYLSP